MNPSFNYMAQFRLPADVYEKLLSEAQKAGVSRSEYLAKLLANFFDNTNSLSYQMRGCEPPFPVNGFRDRCFRDKLYSPYVDSGKITLS